MTENPAWKPVPELFELVTWADIREGDHVWSMGGVCVITRGAFRNDDEHDRRLRTGTMRFGHRNESGSEFTPPMELAHRVPRLVPLKAAKAGATVTVRAFDLEYLLAHYADEVHGTPDCSHWRLPLLHEAADRLNEALKEGSGD